MRDILLLWIFVPWLIFTIVPHPSSVKYVAPCLPAIALLSTIGFMQLLRQKKKLKYCLIGLMVIVGIIQYYDASFGLGLNLHRYAMRINSRKVHMFFTDDPNTEMWNRPQDINGFGKIVSATRKSMSDSQERMLIYAFTDANSGMGTHYSAWYAIIRFKDLPFELRPMMDDACVGVFDGDKFETSSILQGLQQADYILYYGPSAADIKAPSYMDQLLTTRVRSDLQAHFKKSKGKLLSLNQFSRSEDLWKFRRKFQEIINNFEPIEEIAGIGEEGNHKAFLYKRRNQRSRTKKIKKFWKGLAVNEN